MGGAKPIKPSDNTIPGGSVKTDIKLAGSARRGGRSLPYACGEHSGGGLGWVAGLPAAPRAAQADTVGQPGHSGASRESSERLRNSKLLDFRPCLHTIRARFDQMVREHGDMKIRGGPARPIRPLAVV